MLLFSLCCLPLAEIALCSEHSKKLHTGRQTGGYILELLFKPVHLICVQNYDSVQLALGSFGILIRTDSTEPILSRDGHRCSARRGSVLRGFGMEGESGPGVVTPASCRPEEMEGSRTRRKKRKKKEIIYRSEAEDQEEGEGSEVTGEAEGSEVMDGPLSTPPLEEAEWDTPADGRFVTLTGTITRGKRKGELVEIRLNLTERELRDMARSKERLDAECEDTGSRHTVCTLEVGQGPHVLLWSLSCSPFVFLLAFITSFYYGTLTWYNIFLVYNEERTFLHKVLVCPLLVLSYPLLMVLLCVCVAVYAAATQLSWSIAAWWQAVADLEKGVCGWACGKLGLEDCAPYSVVELLDSDTLSGTLHSQPEGMSSV